MILTIDDNDQRGPYTLTVSRRGAGASAGVTFRIVRGDHVEVCEISVAEWQQLLKAGGAL